VGGESSVRELGYALEEFRLHLPHALRGCSWRQDEDGTVVAEPAGGGRVAIRAEALPPRRLSALLALPCCRVQFAFEGVDAAGRAAFLANFDRAFQRGGG
jgi:hypothetical protein